MHLATKYKQLLCINSDIPHRTGFTKGCHYKIIRHFQSGTLFIYDVINDAGKIVTVEMTGVLMQFIGVLDQDSAR